MARIPTIAAWLNSHSQGYALNLGSKETEWGDVRVDLNERGRPTIIADSRALPLKDSTFDGCIFADVLEHIPSGHEVKVLMEIARVLRPHGWLLTTTPNDRFWFRVLDPAWWVVSHRHYSRDELLRLLRTTGFESDLVGTIGDPLYEIISLLLMYCAYPIKRITGRYPPLPGQAEADQLRADESGYIHFVIARHVNPRQGQLRVR